MMTAGNSSAAELSQMADLLFEIGTEELPAWYPERATADMEQLLKAALVNAGISHGEITRYSSPRRLALLVRDLPEYSERRTSKRRGPPVAAAFDAAGEPTRAALGFAESNGVSADALTVESGPRGEYVYATIETGGEAVAELLPPLLAELVRAVPAPRKMRWGDVDDAFVRPVAWLTARLDDRVPGLSAAGQQAGGTTRGHRFLHDGDVTFAVPADYAAALADAFVIADPQSRLELTRQLVTDLAAGNGLSPEPDAALLAEVNGLVEYPFPIMGSFDPEYLQLPAEVLTTVLIVHQRFFPLRDASGKLAPAFIGVSNNRVADESVVRKGYEQVLAGRLYDARFFWDADRRKSLAQHAWGLSGIGYHRELGSMAEKVARVGSAALALAELLGLEEEQHELLREAVPLFRSDLVTGMVNEFPELEGTMARAYALAEGLPGGVATVLEEGTQPSGPDSALPKSPAGLVLAVSDRLEKIVGFIAVGRKPSGSADPFGLRRDAIGVARMLNASGWQAPPAQLLEPVAEAFGDTIEISTQHVQEAARFVWERVSALLQEEGLPVRVIRAASAGDTPVIAASRRAHLLAGLMRTEEFAELAELYKRVANITSGVTAAEGVDSGLLQEPQEQELAAALPAARQGAEQLLALAGSRLEPWDLGKGPVADLGEAGSELQAALFTLLQVKQPLDRFLDDVHVMVDDQKVRTNRLQLLAAVRDSLSGLGALEELGV